MTNTREPSYYEIALTNRQVLVAFVVLLVCLVTAFFAGAWISRDAAPESISRAAETAATTASAPTNTPPAESVGELNFFSEGDSSGSGSLSELKPVPKKVVPVETTLTEDVAGDGSSPPPIVSPAAIEPRPAPVIQKPAGDQPAASAEAGDLVVQVFSSADRTQATQVVDSLRSAGYPAFLSPVGVNSRTMYRVRIGPYTERGKAEQVADQVRTSQKLDTWITSQ